MPVTEEKSNDDKFRKIVTVVPADKNRDSVVFHGVYRKVSYQNRIFCITTAAGNYLFPRDGVFEIKVEIDPVQDNSVQQ